MWPIIAAMWVSITPNKMLAIEATAIAVYEPFKLHARNGTSREGGAPSAFSSILIHLVGLNLRKNNR